MSNLFFILMIKPFAEINIVGMLISISLSFVVLYSLYSAFTRCYRVLFIHAWMSETKVVQAKVVTLSYRANSRGKTHSPSTSNPNAKTPEEFSVVLRSDIFKRLVVQNETLFDSVEDGDSFLLEYKEKFEYLVFNPNKKIFVKLVPVRATIKGGDVIHLI